MSAKYCWMRETLLVSMLFPLPTNDFQHHHLISVVQSSWPWYWFQIYIIYIYQILSISFRDVLCKYIRFLDGCSATSTPNQASRYPPFSHPRISYRGFDCADCGSVWHSETRPTKKRPFWDVKKNMIKPCMATAMKHGNLHGKYPPFHFCFIGEVLKKYLSQTCHIKA